MIKLTQEGLVYFNPIQQLTIRLSREESTQLLKITEFPEDTPPEIVHLEISNQCNLNCKYCYIGKKKGKELNCFQWQKIIKELANNGVFQLTFGGGEPTMREDLLELARYVKSCGLTLCMTTNGINLTNFLKDELKIFDQINVSWHNQKEFEEALCWLKICEVKRGINFTLSKDYFDDLFYIIKMAEKYDAEILFLTYKPVNKDYKNQIKPEIVYRVAKETYEFTNKSVAVDGLTCKSCLAGKRFCDIDSLGNVLLCSFLREPIGNLLKENFADIWSRRNKNPKCPYLEGGEKNEN